ncbi:hypothetical protein A4X17_18080 [Plantibacter sp. H53]|uniref:glycosyltransferase family 1 protein n=1 Tax=Plantibacter sp. H53 TaxID=1827323 RepID=UPI0007D98266|nr:glycosyltransferase family 1 protein [Plantibacter sp. H53]OAN29675.1 hypothetical protein A4X17_18080 [Plantibacter sp. H53]
MALTAGEQFEVEVWAIDSGSIWVGASQFPFEVRVFATAQDVALQLRSRAESERLCLWIAKGMGSLSSIVDNIGSISNAILIADFDDDDVGIARSTTRKSLAHRLKLNPLHPDSPERILAAQRRVWVTADALTFSSPSLEAKYRERMPATSTRSAVIPHTRLDRSEPSGPSTSNSGLRVGFLGTVVHYKGPEHLISLARSDQSVTVVTFEQRWQPPADLRDQWQLLAPSTPLPKVYSDLDYLLVPSRDSDDATSHQLPAKMVDAAMSGVPVAATPTAPIEDFFSGAFIPIDDWQDPLRVLETIRSADRTQLGLAIRQRYEQYLTPSATGTTFAELVSRTVGVL